MGCAPSRLRRRGGSSTPARAPSSPYVTVVPYGAISHNVSRTRRCVASTPCQIEHHVERLALAARSYSSSWAAASIAAATASRFRASRSRDYLHPVSERDVSRPLSPRRLPFRAASRRGRRLQLGSAAGSRYADSASSSAATSTSALQLVQRAAESTLALELADTLAREPELASDPTRAAAARRRDEAQLRGSGAPAPEACSARPVTASRRKDSPASSDGVGRVGSANRSPSSPPSSSPTAWFSETDASTAPSASSTCSQLAAASLGQLLVASPRGRASPRAAARSRDELRRGARARARGRGSSATGSTIARWHAWRIHQVA